jgi:subtilase family serine protease
MSDPQIPAAISPVVVGIKALHNFLPEPLHKAVGQARFDKQSGRWQRVTADSATAANSSALTPLPQFGINVPGSSNNSAHLEEDVTPWDFATIYNITPLWSAGIDGTGQTIAIAGTSLITPGDVAAFRSDFALPAIPSFKQIDTGDGPTAARCTSTSPYASCGIGDLDENTLDVEWSGAVATGASIALVVTGQNSAGTVDTVYDSAQYVVQNVTAKILTVSYGLCELAQGTAQNVAFYNLWQSAAAEGIAVFVAAGDSGAPSCDQGGDSIGWPYSTQYGLSVSGLASTPYNVAVGGTDFTWCKPTISSNGTLSG